MNTNTHIVWNNVLVGVRNVGRGEKKKIKNIAYRKKRKAKKISFNSMNLFAFYFATSTDLVTRAFSFLLFAGGKGKVMWW